MVIENIKKIILNENNDFNSLLYNYNIIDFNYIHYSPAVTFTLSNIHARKIVHIVIYGGYGEILLEIFDLNTYELLRVGRILYFSCGISTDLSMHAKLEQFGGNDIAERIKNCFHYLNTFNSPILRAIFRMSYWCSDPYSWDPKYK